MTQAVRKTLKNKPAGEVLKNAHELVTGSREQKHGDIEECFTITADLWSSYLGNRDLSGFPLTASEVCDLMELLKIARRRGGKFNPDDYVDGAGYAACAFQCRSAAEGSAE